MTFKQLAQQAHQIKGASANVGSTVMQLTAEKLEKLADNLEYQGTTHLISDLEQFVKRIQDFLIKSQQQKLRL